LSFGKTILHYAIAHGNAEAVSELVKFDRIAINAQDSQKRTPLHEATNKVELPKLDDDSDDEESSEGANGKDEEKGEASEAKGSKIEDNKEAESEGETILEGLDPFALFREYREKRALQMKRLDCAQIIIDLEGTSKQANVLLEDSQGRTPYEQVKELIGLKGNNHCSCCICMDMLWMNLQ
jgi:ankyrin repeat protein